MSMTLREASEKLGISKQRLYRYCIKERITDAHRGESPMHITDAEYRKCVQYFQGDELHQTPHQTASDEAHHEALQTEVEFLREEVRELRRLLDQQQQLQLQLLAQLQNDKLLDAPKEDPKKEESQPRKTFWQRLFE